MNKKEFLEELEERLIGISKEDKEEILQDYEEHFKAGKKKKRTDEEISKSLGDPKEIAKEIRKELSCKKEGEELKTEAIETWVALKRFSKHIFNETQDKINYISNRFNPKKVSHWVWAALGIIFFFIFISILGGMLGFLVLLIVLIFLAIKFSGRKRKTEKEKKNQKKKQIHSNKSVPKTIFVLLFNIIISIWIWISLFFAIIAFFISGFVMIITGLLLSVFSIFYLIQYSNPVLKDLLLSGLFAGIGISILGILFTILSDKILRIFFGVTKKYLKLNQRLIKK